MKKLLVRWVDFLFGARSVEAVGARRLRNAVLGVIGLSILILLNFLYLDDIGVTHWSGENLLAVTLLNLNVVLVLALLLLVVRNLVKLFAERRSQVLGARFRTKLVSSFVLLALAPSIILFVLASGLITDIIRTWFNAQTQQSLEEAMEVAQAYYENTEQSLRYFSQQIARTLSEQGLSELDAGPHAPDLAGLLPNLLEEMDLEGVQVYTADLRLVAQEGDSRIVSRDLVKEDTAPFHAALARRTELAIRPHAGGDIVQAYAPVFSAREPRQVAGVVVVSQLVPQNVVAKMRAVTTAFREYNKLKILRNPITTSYLIAFLLITLVIVFGAVWLGLYVAKGITLPIEALAEGTRRVAEGDLNVRVDARANDEIGLLVDSFNQMTRDLREGEAELVRTNRHLQEINAELEQRRHYTETLLRHITTSVLSLDPQGQVLTLNDAASKLLDLEAEEIRAQSFERVLAGEGLEPLRAFILDGRGRPGRNHEGEIQVQVAAETKIIRAHMVSLDERENHLGFVVVLDDLTDLLRAQRTAAWQEAARRLAHEIKNPLTPIQLSAQRLMKKYREGSVDFEAVLAECIATIIAEVKGLKDLVNEFTQFARLPEVRPRPHDLHELIGEVAGLYAATDSSIRLVIERDPRVPVFSFDRDLIRRALINLVDNALEASGDTPGQVLLRTELAADGASVCIEVCDWGQGIAEEHRESVLQPYFTTKPEGTGLGLAIVSRIMADHQGRVSIRPNEPAGTRAVLELPLTPLGTGSAVGVGGSVGTWKGDTYSS